MSNGVFKVGPIGAAILDADAAWHRYADTYDIKDPWRQIRLLRHVDSKILEDGSMYVEFGDETEEEISQINYWKGQQEPYRKLEFHWELIWLLKNYGYEYAESFAKLHEKQIWETFCSLMPCKYDECNLYCKRVEKCAQEGFIENGTN